MIECLVYGFAIYGILNGVRNILEDRQELVSWGQILVMTALNLAILGTIGYVIVSFK